MGKIVLLFYFMLEKQRNQCFYQSKYELGIHQCISLDTESSYVDIKCIISYSHMPNTLGDTAHISAFLYLEMSCSGILLSISPPFYPRNDVHRNSHNPFQFFPCTTCMKYCNFDKQIQFQLNFLHISPSMYLFPSQAADPSCKRCTSFSPFQYMYYTLDDTECKYRHLKR